MTTQPSVEMPISATVKLPESLWKRVKIEAIREGCTVGELVRRRLEATLTEPVGLPRRKKTEKGGAE